MAAETEKEMPTECAGTPMKQYTARIINPSKNWHAMVIHLQAENIVSAANDIMDTLMCLGVIEDQVTQLTEIVR
jgi:hypothetical protein